MCFAVELEVGCMVSSLIFFVVSNVDEGAFLCSMFACFVRSLCRYNLLSGSPGAICIRILLVSSRFGFIQMFRIRRL